MEPEVEGLLTGQPVLDADNVMSLGSGWFGDRLPRMTMYRIVSDYAFSIIVAENLFDAIEVFKGSVHGDELIQEIALVPESDMRHRGILVQASTDG